MLGLMSVRSPDQLNVSHHSSIPERDPTLTKSSNGETHGSLDKKLTLNDDCKINMYITTEIENPNCYGIIVSSSSVMKYFFI